MIKNYTRQRQGRDFSILEQLRKAPKHPDNAETEREKKSMHDRLEQYKTDTENNRDRAETPVDGHEPPEMEGLTR